MEPKSEVKHLEGLMAQTYELENRIRRLESVIAQLRDEFDRALTDDATSAGASGQLV